jgi:hypothetical protein
LHMIVRLLFYISMYIIEPWSWYRYKTEIEHMRSAAAGYGLISSIEWLINK